jgi:hypothetical protein
MACGRTLQGRTHGNCHDLVNPLSPAPNSSHESIYLALSRSEPEFGKRFVSNPPYQNGSGATWNDQTAYWVTSSLHAVLTQDNNPADQTLGLDIESRVAYDTKVQQQLNRPTSLD